MSLASLQTAKSGRLLEMKIRDLSSQIRELVASRVVKISAQLESVSFL